MKIFLLGYMGSGKSTAGKKLASKLGMDFLDLDEYIEKEYGSSITEIFESEGEEKFRELEHLYLQRVVLMDNIIISVGGGTPCYYNNIEIINNNGLSVYFKMSVDTLVNRLVNAKKQRPLIKGMAESDLKNFIEANLGNREYFYAQAHYKVKAKSLDIDELAEFLRKEVGVRATASAG
jgi:shikimate kinase